MDTESSATNDASAEQGGFLSFLGKAAVFVFVLVLALVGGFVGTLMGTRALFSPDIGIGAAFAVWIAVPLATLIGAVVAYGFRRRDPLAFRHICFLALSIGLAALLGPLVVFVLLRVV